MTVINIGSTINIVSTDQDRGIKWVGNNSSKVDNIGVINTNSIGFVKISKLAKTKNLI